MKQIWERIMDLFPGKKAETARYVLLAVAAGILFLWSGDLFGLVSTRQAPQTTPVLTSEPVTEDELARWEARAAKDLEESLALIQGVGDVKVSLSVESGPAITVAKDITTEKTKTSEVAEDKSTRETETTSIHETHLLQKGSANDTPVVTMQSRPVIAGVLVVAEGAWNAEVKARLWKATYTKLGIAPHRVTIEVARRGGE